MRPAGEKSPHPGVWILCGVCVLQPLSGDRVRACLESAIGRRFPSKDVVILVVATVTGSGVNPTHHSSALACLRLLFFWWVWLGWWPESCNIMAMP